MKCKIEGCKFEGADLTKHIICTHEMIISDYENKYGNEIVDSILKKKRAKTRKDNYKFECFICKKKFQNEKCLEYHYKESKDIEHSRYFYNETNTDDWVECTICGFRGYSLVTHIKIHNKIAENYEGELRSKTCIKVFEESQKNTREKFKVVCQGCNEKFKTESSLQKHMINSKKIECNHILYNDNNKDEWVECKICEHRKNVLTMHLKKEHNMTVDYYKSNYSSVIYSERMSFK